MSMDMNCMQRTENHLPRLLIDALPNPVCIVDRKNRVRFVNRRALEMLGSKSDDALIGHSLIEFLAPEDRERAERDLQRCNEFMPGSPHEYQIVNDRGERIPIVATSAIVPCDNDSECIICVGTSAEAKNSLLQANNLASSRAMLYLDILRNNVSNKLQIILSSVELLMQDGLKENKKPELLSNVLQAVDCCQESIRYAEEMERLLVEPLRPRRLDLAIRNAILDVYNNREDINLSASFGVGEGIVMADGSLENLVRNLIDEICLCNPREDKLVSIDVRETESEYLIMIADNGVGIHDSKKNVFNGDRKGRLPGIQVCRTIVEKYGGSLTILDKVIDRPHNGVRARVTFPRCEYPESH